MSGERRQVRKAIADAFGLDFKGENSTLDKAADSVIEVFNRVRPLPGAWGLAAGGLPGRDINSETEKEILDELERGLKINIPRDNISADKAHKIRLDGRSVGEWLEWYRSDQFRLQSMCYMNIEKVWSMWPQAFDDGGIKITKTGDGGMNV